MTSTEHRSDAAILGRTSVNDVDTILDICRSNAHSDEVTHIVPDASDALFTWDYDKGARPKLEKLYEKGKTSQWNANDLPWHLEVDPRTIFRVGDQLPPTREDMAGDPSSPLHKWIDAKYYAATQVVDEARHVEVFGRYLRTKLNSEYPINPHLRLLLDDIINDSRWDMTYLGMQIMVEGLALAAFGFMYQLTPEPLLKQLLRYVMADEARHVAFGVLSLQEFYSELTVPELRERQEFAFEAAVRMRDRFLSQEVWERLGVPVRPMVENFLSLPAEQKPFQNILFSKIVPNCKKLGLLDAGDGWLRRRFEEIHVIEFEDWVDTGEEYEVFQIEEEAAAV